MLSKTRQSKTLPVFVLLALLFLCSGAYAQRFRDNREKLEEVNDYAAQREKAINQYYDDQIDALKQRADMEIKQLEEQAAARLEQEDAAKKAFHLDEQGFIPKESMVTDAEKTAAEDSVKAQKAQIMARLAAEVEDLEKQRAFEIDVRLDDLRKQLREDIIQGKPEPTHGVVTGIVFSEERALALIDGEIVSSGDEVYGTKVVGIDPRSVEFEKDGRKWKQRVGQRAEPFWQEQAANS